jgi:hypothetical protein
MSVSAIAKNIRNGHARDLTQSLSALIATAVNPTMVSPSDRLAIYHDLYHQNARMQTDDAKPVRYCIKNRHKIAICWTPLDSAGRYIGDLSGIATGLQDIEIER